MANILIGYEKIQSEKTGVLKHYSKFYMINDEPVITEKKHVHVVTEVFLEGQIVDNKLVPVGDVETQGDIAVGCRVKVLKESINGRDEVAYISFSPVKK